MKRASILLIVLASFALPVAAQAKGSARDREAIKNIALAWQDNWNRHDIKALAALLAEDVDLVTVAGTRLKSREQFEKDHAKGHKAIFKESVLTTKNVEAKFIRPDVAVAHVEWNIRGVKEQDGKLRAAQQGIFTWVVEKRKGKWLIIAGQNTILRDASTAPAELRVLSAVGMRQVMLDLAPKFEHATGHRLAISFDSGGVILKRVEGGETADVVMIPRSGIERLAEAGILVAGSVTDLAASRVGVAVRKRAPKPDISSPEAFKRALLDAKTIACPNPALGGSSGVHIAKVFEQLGIAEEVKPKLVFASRPGEATAMPGYLVATGKAEIALHQMQELMAVPGIEIVGPLPGDLQETFVFSAAIMANAKEVKAAKALVEFLRTPDARVVIKAIGMDPAAP